jgi:PAS domain S-box-containing protein
MPELVAASLEERVLLLVPTARDAAGTKRVFEDADIASHTCRDLLELCEEAERGAGAVLIAEEALLFDKGKHLRRLLDDQEPWSDLPLIVLTPSGSDSRGTTEALRSFGNVTLVKRPVQISILISTTRAALRDRGRQYKVRSLLENEKRHADELNRSEKRLRLTVESVRDYAIFGTDANGAISTWNSGAERVFGWSESEILGQNASVLFTPEGRALGLPERELAIALLTGRAEHEEWQECKDGRRFFASGITTPICDENGVHTGFTKVARDVTQRKHAEDALREADRRKDEFLAMLAHELRNPLAAVANAIHVLKMSNSSEHVDFAKDVVERQVRQLTRLIDDLLDVSRITTGKIRLRREFVDAAALLDQAIESARPLINERKHELIQSIDRGNLPLKADPARFEQIVLNLLTNAAKYTESGGRVWLTAKNNGEHVVISVRDNGMGIVPEKIPEMFQLFSQGERSIARSEGGLGIGLTIVQKLTEMHGGTVAADSEGIGKGSEFTIRLPVARKSAATVSRSEAKIADLRSQTRILVVDDNVDTADGLDHLLRILGNEVRLAHDGPSALAVAESFKPEFVLLDIGLPGMDGYEVVTKLREAEFGKDAIIIAVTGYGQDKDRRRSHAAGFDHHLVKPIDFDSLVSLIGHTSPIH